MKATLVSKPTQKKVVQKKRLIAFLACLLSFIVFSTIDLSYAAKPVTKPQKTFVVLSWAELKSKAASLNLELIAFPGAVKTDASFKIQHAQLKDKERFRTFLLQELQNVAIVSEPQKEILYILPKGFSVRQFTGIQKAFRNTQFEDAFKDFQNGKNIVFPESQDLLATQEMKTLASLAASEKEKTIHYDRVINPEAPSAVYAFDVKYNDQLKMMLPERKDGENVRGKMEGFINFSSVYGYLSSQTDNMQAFRTEKRLFLQSRVNAESVIAVDSSGDVMTIAQRLRAPNAPKIDLFISGNNREFQSLTRLYFDEGILCIADTGSNR